MFEKEVWSEEARHILESLHERYCVKAESVVCGRNRVCYLLPRYVVKLPLNGFGTTDNDWEGSVSNLEAYDPVEDIGYPRTHLRYVGSLMLPILFMERVRTDLTPQEVAQLPGWVASVDSGQVGFTKQGKLVVYDYGIY